MPKWSRTRSFWVHNMSRNKKALLRILITTVLLAALVAVTHLTSLPWYWEVMTYLAVYLLIGYDIVGEAVGGIGRGQVFDENFLMVLATIGAFGTGEYPEAVAVMLLYQTGELFQRYAVGKSRGSISELMNLRPDTARLLIDGQEQEVLPEEVEAGQVILVKPGERVPLDGVVIRGQSALDTAALTGESMPRPCGPGDEILSGVISTSGVLEIRVEKAFYDSTVSKILDMVENASGKKARAEKFITRFAKYYTPIVVGLAVAFAVIPPLFDGRWVLWIQKALNFLVVSCPCALVISVPLSFFGGIGAASKKGILVKGGSYLEQLSKADLFVFDKTGTLTKGSFEVTQVLPESSREEILRTAAIAERGSLHPIAQSVLRAAGDPGEEGWSLTEEAGRGVRAEKDGVQILAGNSRLMEEAGISVSVPDAVGTVVYVAKNGAYLGCIVISDALKEDSVAAVAGLKALGARTVMLTGDNETAAAAVAKQVGVTQYAAGLLPGDKVQKVEELLQKKEKGSVLAFVGDGINDAPVLMRADVGVAMGGIGSDAAIEAADVVLMHDRLSALPVAKEIASKTMKIVRQNIVFALGIKLLVLTLTPFGLVSIWLAIFADVGVAMLAILNAMRAGRV